MRAHRREHLRAGEQLDRCVTPGLAQAGKDVVRVALVIDDQHSARHGETLRDWQRVTVARTHGPPRDATAAAWSEPIRSNDRLPLIVAHRDAAGKSLASGRFLPFFPELSSMPSARRPIRGPKHRPRGDFSRPGSPQSSTHLIRRMAKSGKEINEERANKETRKKELRHAPTHRIPGLVRLPSSS